MQHSWRAIFSMLLFFALLMLAMGYHLVFWTPADYPIDRVWDVPGGDPAEGQMAIVRHGCGACHVIPGVRQATGRVGPRLNDLRNQVYLAGVLPNTPENLVLWIQHPQEVNPLTAMPDLDITEEEARDIAAYLYRMR